MPHHRVTQAIQAMLTKYNKPKLVDAKRISKFPVEKCILVDGVQTNETETVMMRLKFHLGRITLEHPSGSTSVIRHTARTVDGKRCHKVTWENHIPGIRPMKREFYSAENLGEFLVGRYGIRLTTKILTTMSELEQESASTQH